MLHVPEFTSRSWLGGPGNGWPNMGEYARDLPFNTKCKNDNLTPRKRHKIGCSLRAAASVATGHTPKPLCHKKRTSDSQENDVGSYDDAGKTGAQTRVERTGQAGCCGEWQSASRGAEQAAEHQGEAQGSSETTLIEEDSHEACGCNHQLKRHTQPSKVEGKVAPDRLYTKVKPCGKLEQHSWRPAMKEPGAWRRRVGDSQTRRCVERA